MLGILLSLVAGLGVAAPAKVFLLAGQSNMSGFGHSSEASSSDAPSRVQAFYAVEGGGLGGPVLVTPGAANDDHTRFGLEVGIGKSLEEAFPLDKIIFIKVSAGGTSLQGGAEEPVWRGGTLYRDFFKPRVEEAIAKLSDRTKYPEGFEIAGLFWMQGENDAMFGSTSIQGGYSTALKRFVEDDLRAYLSPFQPAGNVKPIPFVYGMIRSHWPFAGRIQEEQRKFQFMSANVRCVHEGKLASVYPPRRDFVAFFNMDHYNAQGLLRLGNRMGVAMASLLRGESRIGCPSVAANIGLHDRDE